MFRMHVSKYFWADAISITCFLITRVPSSALKGEMPFHTLCPKQHLFPIPLKIFGCTCFVRDVRPLHTNLDPKALNVSSLVILVFRCYFLSLNKYFVSPDVTFFEHSFFYSFTFFLLRVRGSIRSEG